MKKQILDEALNEVTSNVLEQIAFVFTEPTDMSDGLNFGDFEMATVTLQYSGDEHGTVSLVLPVEFCRELSESMLGTDATDADLEMYLDSAKELLNIIAGQLMTQLFGETAVLNLSPPELRTITNEELQKEISKQSYVCNMADDYPVITTLSHTKESHEHQGINS